MGTSDVTRRSRADALDRYRVEQAAADPAVATEPTSEPPSEHERGVAEAARRFSTTPRRAPRYGSEQVRAQLTRRFGPDPDGDAA